MDVTAASEKGSQLPDCLTVTFSLLEGIGFEGMMDIGRNLIRPKSFLPCPERSIHPKEQL